MLTTTRPSLTIKRRFKASPAKVFAAWTRPEQIAKWFAPQGAPDANASVDLREGGNYEIRSCCVHDGKPNQLGGTYLEIVQDRKLVFTWAFQGDSHGMPPHESIVTLEFKPDGDGTLMTLHHEQFRDEPERDSHSEGWAAILDELDAYLS